MKTMEPNKMYHKITNTRKVNRLKTVFDFDKDSEMAKDS